MGEPQDVENSKKKGGNYRRRPPPPSGEDTHTSGSRPFSSSYRVTLSLNFKFFSILSLLDRVGLILKTKGRGFGRVGNGRHNYVLTII